MNSRHKSLSQKKKKKKKKIAFSKSCQIWDMFVQNLVSVLNFEASHQQHAKIFVYGTFGLRIYIHV